MPTATKLLQRRDGKKALEMTLTEVHYPVNLDVSLFADPRPYTHHTQCNLRPQERRRPDDGRVRAEKEGQRRGDCRRGQRRLVLRSRTIDSDFFSYFIRRCYAVTLCSPSSTAVNRFSPSPTLSPT